MAEQFIRIREIPPTFEDVVRCLTCGGKIPLGRGNFPICNDCINDLQEIIAERRKPKVVEIGQTNQGGENG